MTATSPSVEVVRRLEGGRSATAVRVALAALAAVSMALLLVRSLDGDTVEPTDLAINLVAAERLADGEPLYETVESRRRAVELGGAHLGHLYREPTNSYAGPPSTALLHLPYALVDHDLGVALFRLSVIAGLVGALGLVARPLPEGRRLDAFLLGVAALGLSTAVTETITYGQGHHLVVLGLAVGIWATARQRWWLVGAGIGFAAVLKLSPAIILVYLVVRGRRQVVGGALATAAALTVAAALVGGRPGDLLVWARDVAPELSRGVIRSSNQALPAALARLTAPAAEVAGTGELGAVRLIALPLLVVGAAALWRARRGRPVDPVEIVVLALLGLLVGPLTWIHYGTWATVAVVALAPRATTPARVGALLAAVALLAVPVVRPAASEIADAWLLRVTPNPGLAAVALLLVLAVASLERRTATPIR